MEDHPQLFIDHFVVLGRLLKRILKKSGCLFVNLGDTYYTHTSKRSGQFGKEIREGFDDIYTKSRKIINNGGWLQEKQKLLIPERVAIALQNDGWILRNDIIWHKPNHMPSSVKDRFTNSWEHIYFFAKSPRYWFDLDAIRQPHKGIDPTNSNFRPNKLSQFQQNIRKTYEGKTSNMANAGHGYNPLGKCPDDVYQGKFDGFGGESEKFGSPRARNERYQSKFPDSMQSGNFTQRNAQARAEGMPHDNPLGNPLGKSPDDFWEITTQPFSKYWCPTCQKMVKPKAAMTCPFCKAKVTSHFAVYPERLCVDPIKASCPEWICRKCGKPRTRITKTKTITTRNLNKEYKTRDPERHIIDSINTVGWTDCGCNHDDGWDSGVVLDPFCGSGTTLLVARKLCRHFIGIELNGDYAEMARKRIAQVGTRLDILEENKK